MPPRIQKITSQNLALHITGVTIQDATTAIPLASSGIVLSLHLITDWGDLLPSVHGEGTCTDIPSPRNLAPTRSVRT